MDYSCFRDQVVVITGGGGEIGGGTAREVCRHGASVALIDIHEGRLEETAQVLLKSGVKKHKILTYRGDVTNNEVIEEFTNAVVQYFGQINVLVNIVGTNSLTTLSTMTEGDLEWCINGNLKSTVFMTKACLPHLIKTKGNIITLSSVSGQRPMWGALPYAMAKAGVDMFTRCVSQELAPDGVRVNAVSPGALKSRYNIRFGDILSTEEQLKSFWDMAERSTPLGYAGTWEDVVPVIMFLASEQASFMTGTVITVDGGYTNTCHSP